MFWQGVARVRGVGVGTGVGWEGIGEGIRVSANHAHPAHVASLLSLLAAASGADPTLRGGQGVP